MSGDGEEDMGRCNVQIYSSKIVGWLWGVKALKSAFYTCAKSQFPHFIKSLMLNTCNQLISIYFMWCPMLNTSNQLPHVTQNQLPHVNVFHTKPHVQVQHMQSAHINAFHIKCLTSNACNQLPILVLLRIEVVYKWPHVRCCNQLHHINVFDGMPHVNTYVINYCRLIDFINGLMLNTCNQLPHIDVFHDKHINALH